MDSTLGLISTTSEPVNTNFWASKAVGIPLKEAVIKYRT